MNRFSTKMVKWLACGAVLLMSGTAYADYKKGDVVQLTPNLKGTLLEDQVSSKNYINVEVSQDATNQPSGALTINASYTVDGQIFEVHAVAADAFKINSGITSVTLPTSVTSIKTSAFYGCTNLTKINLTDVQYVYDSAFWMSGITEAIMTNVWSIGKQSFAYCNSLTKVDIGKACNIIDGMAFRCQHLKQATLHYGLTTIGTNNFTASLDLEDFVLPYTVTSIQDDLTSTSAMSRLFLLAPDFSKWYSSTSEDEKPLGLSLLRHSGLKEIYTLDELVDDVNAILTARKGQLNMPDIQAKSVSELVEVVPVKGETGKFTIVKHNEDIPFIEIYKAVAKPTDYDRIYPDNNGVYDAKGAEQVIIDYTVDKINPLRYVVSVVEPEPENKYPVTEEQVVKMHGDIFWGSSDWTDGIMTKEDGLWVMKDVKVKSGNFGIKIFENAETDKSTWVNSVNRNNPTVVLNEMNEGTASGGENWYIQKGTYTFTFNPGMYELYVTGTPDTTPDPDPVYTYLLHGNISDGSINWKDYELTEKDGSWSVSLEEIKGGQFVFKAYDTANERTGSWYYSTKGETEGPVAVKFDTEMPVVTKDGTNWLIGEGSYTFTFNPEEMTLVVTNDNAEEPVAETDYYLVGAVAGWEPVDAYKFTKGENGEYTFELEKLTGEFKITDGDKAVWYGTNKEATLELDKAYICNTADGAGNFSFSEPVLNAKFTFVPATSTLTITGTLQEIQHEYVYTLCGALTQGGDWKEYPMTLADGSWTLTLDNGLVAFQIREYDKAVDANKVNRYIKSDTDGLVEKKGSYGATKEEGKDWISKLDGKCTYTFNPETMILTIDGTTGISSVDAEESEAVYFNLQGQRVANPEKGIFIRVVNGKAQKIVK